MPEVLVLEDESIIAMDLQMLLEERGYTVLGPCASAREAQALLETRAPDAAVLDVSLGRGATSFELALALKAQGVPIVFLSGHSENSVPIPQELHGAQRLSKPVEDESLITAIASVIGSARAG